MSSADRQLANDRRAGRRYSVSAEVRYQIISQPASTAGTGRTVDLSSSGALIETAEHLLEGAKIKLSIAWPARLNGQIALSVDVVGRIARIDGLLDGVAFDRYEFRARVLRNEVGQEAPALAAN